MTVLLKRLQKSISQKPIDIEKQHSDFVIIKEYLHNALKLKMEKTVFLPLSIDASFNKDDPTD